MLPELSLGPFVSLPTYYLYLSLLVTVMYYVTWHWALHQQRDVTLALNLALLITVSGFIGGRLFHVFYEAPEYYQRYPSAIFRFWLGGYVFYGGLMGSAAASWIYLYWKKQNFWDWFDFFAPIFALSYGLGRFACFLAGCCYGRYCDLPWAINGRHPTPLYALGFEILISFFLFRFSMRKTNFPRGGIACIWLLFHSLNRLVMESYREDFRGNFIHGLSISTWISLILFGFAASGLVWVLWPLKTPSFLKKR